MATVVLQLTKEIISKMNEHYQRTLKFPPPSGAVFSAKTTSCTITAYHSGKVLFQGKDAEQESKRWGAPTSTSTTKKSTSSKKAVVIGDATAYPMMGSDEVGTGDYFGPLTVAAVYVSEDKLEFLRSLHITDSKAMTDERIRQIAGKIAKNIPYKTILLDNVKYNDWIERRKWNQGKIKAIMHNHALHGLLEKIKTDYEQPAVIIVDQFTQPTTYYNYLKGLSTPIVRDKMHFETKAESKYIAVAAASILARYRFLVAWDKMNEEIGMTIPKGAGAAVDTAAGKLLRMHGEGFVKKYTKWHFANTDKARKKM